MSVRLVLAVVVRMQSVLTLMAATLAPVLLGILEMDRVVLVSELAQPGPYIVHCHMDTL